MPVTGINVDLTVAGWGGAQTNDPLYLGIYSKHGGREFALQVNGNSPITTVGATTRLVLGQECCQREGTNILQVDNSLSLRENDPALNPIEINEVEFVYLRKYGGVSANTDDWLELSSATILLCDSSGNLARFRKEGRLHFAKEAGQQHYLEKIAPPRCQVTITLNNIHHNDMAARPAGYDWDLNWWGIVPTAISPIWGDSYSEKINRRREPDEWDRQPRSSNSFIVNGCCGIIPVLLMCTSRENDWWPNADDIGSASTSFSIDCSIPNNSIQIDITTLINGSNNNNRSRIIYSFTVTTLCLG